MNQNTLIKVIAVVAFFCVIAFAVLRNPEEKSANQQEATSSLPVTQEEANLVAQASVSTYKDGTYTVVGNYISPGGPESVEVTLTLASDVVVDASVVAQATRPASVNWQGAFIGGYKEYVIGKNIDEITVDKVSGSSLTPKGFNDAVVKIKAEATS
jgi:hypothetical protein